MSQADEPGETGRISVADLLARNDGAAIASGSSGGRRRRGETGGGISVTDLTGEIPVIRDATRHRRAAEPDGDAPEIAEIEPSDAADLAAADDADVAEDDRARILQWLALVAEVGGALVIGGLLFKGFELLWDMMPWVASVLSAMVILGLVALVRVVRRADDILSLVIAIVVGIFVTFGPLAFELGTG